MLEGPFFSVHFSSLMGRKKAAIKKKKNVRILWRKEKNTSFGWVRNIYLYFKDVHSQIFVSLFFHLKLWGWDCLQTHSRETTQGEFLELRPGSQRTRGTSSTAPGHSQVSPCCAAAWAGRGGHDLYFSLISDFLPQPGFLLFPHIH